MQLLVLQFVDPRQSPPRPVFNHHLGTLVALLRGEGFKVALEALPGFDADRLHQAIVHCRPQHIIAELTAGHIAAARRTLVAVAEKYHLPAVVLGPQATSRPAEAVSTPGVRALLLGEYEMSGLDYFQVVREGGDPAGLPGVWVNTDEGLVKGEPRAPIENLDELPRPERAIFDHARQVAETGELLLKSSHGCGGWCAHCCNDWYMELYGEQGPFARHRSVPALLDEIAALAEQSPQARLVRFVDHGFASDADWLGEFALEYPRRCPLPLSCHVRLTDVTPRTASALQAARCRQASVQLGCGSRFIRDEILGINISDDQILQATSLLKQAGIRLCAEVMLGNPYESEITLEETVKLVRAVAPDDVQARIFYPLPGTRAADLCAENGWISGRGEDYYWSGRSVLDMPSLPAGEINALAKRFPSLVKGQSRTGLSWLLRQISGQRKKGFLG